MHLRPGQVGHNHSHQPEPCGRKNASLASGSRLAVQGPHDLYCAATHRQESHHLPARCQRCYYGVLCMRCTNAIHSHVAQRSNGQVRVGGPPTAGLVTTWCAVAHRCRPPLSVHAAHTQRYSVQSNQGRSLFAQRRNCHRRRRFCAKAARPLGPCLPLLSSPHLCSSPPPLLRLLCECFFYILSVPSLPIPLLGRPDHLAANCRFCRITHPSSFLCQTLGLCVVLPSRAPRKASFLLAPPKSPSFLRARL